MWMRIGVFCLVGFVLLGCYHATVETGLEPSNQVLEDGFADSWIYGLVPPSTVETAARCPNGAARIETQVSFVNSLVRVLTLGIYTPMTIKVTCAAAGGREDGGDGESEMSISRDAPVEDVRRAFSEAADQAVQGGRPIVVRFEAVDLP